MIWLKRNGMAKAEIARALEVGESSVARWLKADRVPTRRYEQLLRLGIPAELLPEPVDITPGPKKAAAVS